MAAVKRAYNQPSRLPDWCYSSDHSPAKNAAVDFGGFRASSGIDITCWEGEEGRITPGTRIREDLLPQTPDGSLVPSVSPSTSRNGRQVVPPEQIRSSDACRGLFSQDGVRSANVGTVKASQRPVCRPRLSQDSNSVVEETGKLLFPQPVKNQSEDCFVRRRPEESGSAGVSVMEEWSGLPAAGTIDKTIYQNLVEMIPLMESFMEQKGNRRGFTHHASLVYTPAPPRHGPLQKVSESPLKSKRNKQQRPGSMKQVDVKEENPVWDEQENILRRVEKDVPAEGALYESQALNREELLQLQSQIDELKQQLWEKDCMVQSVRSYESEARTETLSQEAMLELKAKIEELQQNVWEKEQVSQSMQFRLKEKQQELSNMESLLERLQVEVLKKNDAAASMREELNQLRVQVADFQCQIQLQNASEQDACVQDAETLKDCSAEIDQELSSSETSENTAEDDARTMEAARRMYLGAVITAKEKPGAESIALAAEFRKRLQAFLMQPYLNGDSSFLAQTVGFPLV